MKKVGRPNASVKYPSVAPKDRSASRKVIIALLVFVIILILVFVVYLWVSNQTPQEVFSSFLQLFGLVSSAHSNHHGSAQNFDQQKIVLNEAFITALLYDLQAPKHLHQNLLFQKPQINFMLGSKTFNAVINGDDIQTTTGLVDGADIQFNADQATVEYVFNQSDVYDAVHEVIANGRVSIQKLASDTKLVSKGYKGFQDSLS